MNVNKIYVFAKLQSFNNAKQDVLNQLRDDVFKDRTDVEVLDYPAKHPEMKSASYKSVTVVVVLDKRQTRTLVTPSGARRDPNVDHWDEFKDFYRETKPHGSILVVIYGDDVSEGAIIGDSWKQIWKFNDQYAYELLLKDRCFSLPADKEELNGKQKETLKLYIEQIQRYPEQPLKGNMKILVFGDSEILATYLREHKLNTCRPSHHKQMRSEEYANIFQEYIAGKNYSYADVRFTEAKTLQLCGGDGDPVCGAKGDVDCVAAILELISNTELKTTKCVRDPTAKGKRRVLLMCHCKTCFKHVAHLPDKHYQQIKTKLSEVGIKPLDGRVFPIYPRETGDVVEDEDIKEYMNKFIDLKREDVNCLSMKDLADLYVFYLCTPGLKFEPRSS